MISDSRGQSVSLPDPHSNGRDQADGVIRGSPLRIVTVTGLGVVGAFGDLNET